MLFRSANHTRLRSLPAPLPDRDRPDPSSIDDDRPLRRDEDELLVDERERDGDEHVDDPRDEVGEPEADVFLAVGGGELEERTDVDGPVEVLMAGGGEEGSSSQLGQAKRDG